MAKELASYAELSSRGESEMLPFLRSKLKLLLRRLTSLL